MEAKVVLNGRYEVHSDGRVYKINDDGSKVPAKTFPRGTRGYQVISVYENRKQTAYQVSRLVAEAFLPNPDKLPMVVHKNGEPSDNRVENLKWSSHRELASEIAKKKARACLACGTQTCAKDQICTKCKQKEKQKQKADEGRMAREKGIVEEMEGMNLSLLTELEKRTVQLRRQKFSFDEIAEIMGVSRQCVHQRLARAKKKSVTGPRIGKAKTRKLTALKNKLAIIKCDKECLLNRLEDIEEEMSYIEKEILALGIKTETPGAATPRESV